MTNAPGANPMTTRSTRRGGPLPPRRVNPADALFYTAMLDQSAADTGIHVRQGLVDAGYCSAATCRPQLSVIRGVNVEEGPQTVSSLS
jgi:hypothetical protein